MLSFWRSDVDEILDCAGYGEVYEDGSRTLCYIIKDDNGIVKMPSLFRLSAHAP